MPSYQAAKSKNQCYRMTALSLTLPFLKPEEFYSARVGETGERVPYVKWSEKQAGAEGSSQLTSGF